MDANASQIRIRVAAILLEGNRLLLVKHEKEGRAYWLLPGGGVEYGESLSQALVRELREETSLEIAPGAVVLLNDSIAPHGGRHIVNVYFTAKALGGTLSMGSDPRVVAAAFVPLEKLQELQLYPDVREALLEAAQNGFSQSARYLGNLWRD